MRTACRLLAALLLLCTSGCRKAASDDASIRAGILEHLKQNGSINLAAMDTNFQQISVDGDHAQAQVEFRTKQEGATMQMTYALERRGGQWTVLTSRPAGGQIAHPPMDGQHGGAAGPEMPHFHVPGDGSAKPTQGQVNPPAGPASSSGTASPPPASGPASPGRP
jgi:hypothetical protein